MTTSRRGPVVALLLIVSGTPPATAATTAVLFKSGDTATNGLGIGSFESPIASGPATVAFRGTTSAVLVASGTSTVTVARTGDPLPAPLFGTFNDFRAPVINDSGAVAFPAGVNSAVATSAVFLYEGGAFIPVVLSRRDTADINARSDVLLRTRRGDLSVWSRATGTITTTVSARARMADGGRFSRLGSRPVLSDGGAVAFAGDVRFTGKAKRLHRRSRASGIFTVGASGLVTVAEDGGPSPVANGVYAGFTREAALSINAAGEIAFVAATVGAANVDAVLLYRPTGPTTTVVARVGDPVGTGHLTSISFAYVGVNAQGDVAFQGCVDGTRCGTITASGGALTEGAVVGAAEFAPRLTDAGHSAWTIGAAVQRYDGAVTTLHDRGDPTAIGTNVQPSRPSINQHDVVAFSISRDSIYLLDAGVARPLATMGEVVPGGGTIASFGPHRLRDGVVVFRAEAVEDDTAFIATTRGDVLATAVASGDPTPVGGVFDLAGSLVDLTRGDVVFTAAVTGGEAAAGVFRTRAGAPPEALATTGTPAPGGGRFTAFESVLASGRALLVTASLDGDRDAVFFRGGGHRLTKVAAVGDRLPGRGKPTVTGIDAMALDGSRVLIALQGSDERGRLVLWRGSRSTVAAEGKRVRGGGRFGDAFGPVALDGRSIAFVAAISDGPAAAGLFLGRGRTRVPLVLSGAPTPLGGAIDLAETGDDDALSLAGGAVVFRATLNADAIAKSCLLSVTP